MNTQFILAACEAAASREVSKRLNAFAIAHACAEAIGADVGQVTHPTDDVWKFTLRYTHIDRDWWFDVTLSPTGEGGVDVEVLLRHLHLLNHPVQVACGVSPFKLPTVIQGLMLDSLAVVTERTVFA